MKLFGLEISRVKNQQRDLSAVYSPNLWHNLINTVHEPFTGAWQRNVVLDRTSLLSFSAVFCCVTGIASDIAKLRIKLVQDEDRDDIWEEIRENSPWLPLLRKPNHYQVRLKFVEQWIISKLLWGNAYIGKERDSRGVVNALYVLDPSRVTPLISDSGDVFYDLKQDNLSQVPEQMVVPASEIIHDAMPGLFHPLVGTSPLFACALSVQMGDSIQGNSNAFFKNRSQPSGMLTAPGRISDETAKRLKEAFEQGFSGPNLGRTFVGGDGLDWKAFQMTAEQAQLTDQLKFTVSDVARAFHYPEYKLGGPLPPYSGNMQALTLSYYTECLQPIIESLESHLDDGLGLPLHQGTEMDIDNLLRMDTQGMADSVTKLVGGGVMAPNDGRFKFNLQPVKGGDSPYLQQQNYSLEALAKRDAQADPFKTASPASPASPTQPTPSAPPEEEDETDRALLMLNLRSPEDIAFRENQP